MASSVQRLCKRIMKQEDRIKELETELKHLRGLREIPTVFPMRLICPRCAELHIDTGEFATKPHHTHACQNCGEVWRPAVFNTVGVRFLPGFKNE